MAGIKMELPGRSELEQGCTSPSRCPDAPAPRSNAGLEDLLLEMPRTYAIGQVLLRQLDKPRPSDRSSGET
jgi:hypothetical protein